MQLILQFVVMSDCNEFSIKSVNLHPNSTESNIENKFLLKFFSRRKYINCLNTY